MPRFTRDQMLDELRKIFLFEADHIAIGASEAIAEHFIGTQLREQEGERAFSDLSPSRVDLGRFEISRVFERAYGFAFLPGWSNALDTDEVQDLAVFMDGTPRVGDRSMSAGETHRFMTPDGFCRTVADTAYARWKLEIEEAGTFSTRELALLANMSEGAVRNAMAIKGENGLKAIHGSKPIQVEYDEAKRWLLGRRGFMPTPDRFGADPYLKEELASIRTARELGEMIERLRIALEPRILPALKAWPADEIAAWEAGIFIFDLNRVQQLGAALDLDVPLFAAKALEVALRRDASQDHDRAEQASSAPSRGRARLRLVHRSEPDGNGPERYDPEHEPG